MTYIDNMLHKNFVIGEYRLVEHIGKGSYANVWKAEHIQVSTLVAIKVIKKELLNDDVSKTRFEREIKLLKSIHHPYVAEFYELLEDTNHFFIAMEFAEMGSILDFVNAKGKLEESVAKHYFAQIISVMDYLYHKHIVHRDIKCENVLIDKYNNIKIVDFGLSNVFTDEHPFLNTACGSPAYVSPEIVSHNPYTFKTDIWSIGILMYAICAGHLPFNDPNMSKLLQKVVHDNISFPSFFGCSLLDLLVKMLQRNPLLRINLNEILKHEWFDQKEWESCLNACKTISEYNDDVEKQIVSILDHKGILDINYSYSPISMSPIYKIIRRELLKEQTKYHDPMFLFQPISLRPSKQITAPIMKPICNNNDQKAKLKHICFRRCSKPQIFNNPKRKLNCE